MDAAAFRRDTGEENGRPARPVEPCLLILPRGTA
ncbi:hypothetical protein CLV77_1775 [Brevirhabdus pacifica]|nr:hypothetical protein CLV77_1775 [Brevirhabdus pacifica]